MYQRHEPRPPALDAPMRQTPFGVWNAFELLKQEGLELAPIRQTPFGVWNPIPPAPRLGLPTAPMRQTPFGVWNAITLGTIHGDTIRLQ